MKTTVFTIIILLCLSASIQNTYAETNTANFLRIGVGARAAGMGNAFVAIADDATAAYWNPACLNKLSQDQISLTLSDVITGAYQSFLNYVHIIPANPKQTLAVSINYLNYGKIEEWDDNGNNTGNSFYTQQLSFNVSHSRVLFEKLSAGITAKLVSEQFADEKPH